MSYIIPMEKPKRCGLCPCFHAEHPMHCQAVKAHKDKRIIAPYGAPIPDWCPLIELPPHGRLGDLDKLQKQIGNTIQDAHMSLLWKQGMMYAHGLVEASKTVIEAEGEKE